MSIFRTNNPLEYAQVDGIVIDEQAPAPQVQPVGSGVVCLVGQFQRGPLALTRISSTKAFYQSYGKSNYLGNIQLQNKRFATLKIIRVEASDAVKSTLTIQEATDTDNIIKFDALHKGVYGNKIKVTIADGTIDGKKYTIEDTNTDASEFFPTEIYDNLEIADVALAMANSKLVSVAVLLTSAEPKNTASTALATGSDGTIADTDYQTAIAKAEVEKSCNILILDEYNQVRNSYLKIHHGLTQDKMVICAEEESDLTADNVSDVATLRDSAGGIIYAVNWLQTLINGVATFTSPASWYASILSQTSPHIDPAYAQNTQFLYGVIGMKKDLSRDEYIELMEAGCSAFEFDNDIGFKIKSGVVTQIANSSKLTVLRRRMAYFLTDSIGKFLKNYQNAPNSQKNRLASKSAILLFIEQMEKSEILPKDSEVLDGKAKIVDINSENTNDVIASGKFIILYKQRIHSSMRFIVLKAEIGESVVVTEGEG